jgi:hypothetical protein
MLIFTFSFQLEKVYDPKNEEDDMVEMEEERLRMREHVMNEVCFKSSKAYAISMAHSSSCNKS